MGKAHMGQQMRVTLAVSALMLALTGSAEASNKFSWGFIKIDESEVQLSYGLPESDIVPLAYICHTKKKRVEIVTSVLPAKRKKGQPLRTTFRNGAMTAVYDGKVDYSKASDEYHFEVSTAADPKVVDILKSGVSLTISIPGYNERVPLKGVAKPLAQFEAACFRRRPRWRAKRAASAGTYVAAAPAPRVASRHSAARLTVEMPVRAALQRRR